MRNNLYIHDDNENYLVTPKEIKSVKVLDPYDKDQTYKIRLTLQEYITLLNFKDKDKRDNEYLNIIEGLKV